MSNFLKLTAPDVYMHKTLQSESDIFQTVWQYFVAAQLQYFVPAVCGREKVQAPDSAKQFGEESDEAGQALGNSKKQLVNDFYTKQLWRDFLSRMEIGSWNSSRNPRGRLDLFSETPKKGQAAFSSQGHSRCSVVNDDEFVSSRGWRFPCHSTLCVVDAATLP